MRKNNQRGGKSRSARAPRIDSSRRPKPRANRSKATTDQRRANVGSVFASPNAKGAPEEDRGRRLQQVLAAAGYGSRRACEELIADGRVEIDGEIVTELGVRVKPFEQKIRVDGEALKQARPTYIAFNKPKNALCTNNDPSGRRLAIDFIPASFGRLFPVGRLDQNSEGLLLLTNDGALAQRLMHPSYETPKKYRVQVAGLVDRSLVDALKKGVHIAEGVVQADDVVVRSRHKLSSILEITLTEGKNREIRRMLASVGHKVLQLQRVQVGSIKLGDLPQGEFRLLDRKEVAELYSLASERPEFRRRPRQSEVPIEVAELQEREEAKEAERDRKKASDAKKKNDPYFAREVKSQFRRRPAERIYELNEREERPRRREPREEFREEFRDVERADERRRARREFDDETRTIGPRNAARSGRSGQNRFKNVASERGRGARPQRSERPREDRRGTRGESRGGRPGGKRSGR